MAVTRSNGFDPEALLAIKQSFETGYIDVLDAVMQLCRIGFSAAEANGIINKWNDPQKTPRIGW